MHMFPVTIISLGIAILTRVKCDGSIEVDYASNDNSSGYEYTEESGDESESSESPEHQADLDLDAVDSPFKAVSEFMNVPAGVLPLYDADGRRLKTEEVHAIVRNGKIDRMFYDSDGKRVTIPILLRDEDFHAANLTSLLAWIEWVDDMRATLLDLKDKASGCKQQSEEETKGYESVSVMLSDISDALKTLDDCENKLNDHLRNPEKAWNYPSERQQRSVDSVSVGLMKSNPPSEEAGNNFPGIRENFQNFFNAIEENNAPYRQLLQNKMAREKEVFEMAKDSLRMPRMRVTQKRWAPYNTGQRAVSVSKRNAENKDSITDYAVWESTYTKMKTANTESEVLEAANDYQNYTRDETNEVLHELAQFYCAITITRMCMDEVYAREFPHSSPSSPTENWRNLALKARDNATEGSYAYNFREAFKFILRIDSQYAEDFAASAIKTPELCRRYEGKIPELQATYEKQLKGGSRLSLAEVLGNHTDWDMVLDDVFTANRVREADGRVRITWAWIDEESQKVVPLCASNYNPKIVISSVENALKSKKSSSDDGTTTTATAATTITHNITTTTPERARSTNVVHTVVVSPAAQLVKTETVFRLEDGNPEVCQKNDSHLRMEKKFTRTKKSLYFA